MSECVCVFIINYAGTSGAISTRLRTHVTCNPEKNTEGQCTPSNPKNNRRKG